MKVKKILAKSIKITEVEGLDPIDVYLIDPALHVGQITIICWGKAWTTNWGGMGDRTVAQFFYSMDKYYLADRLDSELKSKIYDVDKLKENAQLHGVEVLRDDPWNDYKFLQEMYGDAAEYWEDCLPMMPNPDYTYLCRIIKAVQEALKKGTICSQE